MIKKHLEINNDHQIWRLLINEDDKLLIETRDAERKEVFFSSLEINSGEKSLNNFQFDEKFWLGIEAFYKHVIFLHSFPKPDMPGHKEIIAFDVNSKKVIWHNQDLAFLFCFENIVYAFKQGFEGKFYYKIDFESGEILEQLNDEEFNAVQESYKIYEEEKYEDYLFPEDLDRVDSTGFAEIKDENISGQIEAINFNDLLFIGFNRKLDFEKYENNFRILKRNEDEEIFSKVLDSEIDKMALDSFFIYKNFLFLIVEKKSLEIYKLEK